MCKVTEKELIRQAWNHPEALINLYHRYLPRMFTYIAYRVGSRQDTEDLVAETFLKMVENIAEFEYRGEGSFSAWLFRIARNQVNAFFRRNYQYPDLIPLDELPEIMEDTSLPEDLYLRKEQFERLRGWINTLPPRRMEVIQLKYFAGLHNNEIAKVLSIDERTVASHLSLGLADLRQKINHEIANEETNPNEQPQ